ncbi:MAG: hypothetical protein AB7O67_10665 [Vicinamibacterales bacterium]
MPRVMTPAQLRRADLAMVVIATIGAGFLVWDFRASVAKDVPVMGALAYVTGPIFAHKISEVLVAAAWLFSAYALNHERARTWPAWLPHDRYLRLEPALAVVALVGTVLATYAWTILNLGTSALTTNLAEPPGLGPAGAVWRYYLGAVVLGGVAYVCRILARLSKRARGGGA